MSVMMRITQKISTLPHYLETPSGKPFRIIHVDGEKVLIETGQNPSILTIPAPALDEAPRFLRSNDWIRIAAVHEISDGRSLDSFVKQFSHGTSLASYVAPILEMIGIAEIDRHRPARIRLKSSFL